MKLINKTTLSVSKETKEELNKIGRKGETYDEIIQRLIKVYKKSLGTGLKNTVTKSKGR